MLTLTDISLHFMSYFAFQFQTIGKAIITEAQNHSIQF